MRNFEWDELLKAHVRTDRPEDTHRICEAEKGDGGFEITEISGGQNEQKNLSFMIESLIMWIIGPKHEQISVQTI